MSGHRTTGWGLGALISLAILLVLGVAPVSAKIAHVHEGSVDLPDAGSLDFLLSATVDNADGPSSGSLYVAQFSFETGASRVVKFDDDGGFVAEFRGADSPAGAFGFLSPDSEEDSGIAVDSSAGPNKGDVYVADAANQVIDRFDEDGQYICQITGSSTASASECNGAAGSQTPAGALAPRGLDVDHATGVVYVADAEANAILKFSPDGAYLGQIADPQITAPSSVALDSTGALYVVNSGALADEEPNDVAKFDSAGEFVEVIDDAEPIRIAIDPSDDHVLVAQSGGSEDLYTRIVRYNSAGVQVGVPFGLSEELFLSAVAVNKDSGRVYATNTRIFTAPPTVEVYSPPIVIPDVETGSPVDVGEDAATLAGHVHPAGGGEVTSCGIEYVAAADYDESAPNPYDAGPPPVDCEQALPYGEPTDVSAHVSGLSPSITYRYRVAAENAAGIPSYGEDRVFSTAGPPTVDDQSTGDIGRYGATLKAKVNPHGFATAFRFEYVDEQSYAEDGGFSSAAVRSSELSEIGSGLTPLAVNQGIGSLMVGTTYRYRTIAVSERGLATGAEQSFTTLPVARIEDQWAYARLKSAFVETRINPLGLATQCHVEYVEEEQFEAAGFEGAEVTACAQHPGAASSSSVAKAELAGLRGGARYRYRFVATNQSGVETAANRAFSTFGIENFTVEALDDEGQPHRQAGGHPFETVTRYNFTHNFVPSRDGTAGSLTAFVKEFLIDHPPGRIGSTTAVPRCKGYQVEENRCSGDSQVGVVTVEVFDEGSSTRLTRIREIYAVVPPEGVSGRNSTRGPATATDSRIRTGDDYGITSGSFNLSEEARVIGAEAHYWGVPADPRHDSKRRCPGIGFGCSATVPPKALLRNPTSCGDPLPWEARASTWAWPDEFVTARTETPAMIGCENVEFDPEIEWRPTTTVADSPAGLRTRIHIPQNDDPYGIDVGDLKTGVTTSAKGLIINPAAANGLRGCSPAQIDMDGSDPARCPDASKLGVVEIETPMFDHPLRGGIFLATPHDNQFDSMFAIYLAIDDPETGVVVKIAGEVKPSEQDGQVTATFVDNPQLPIEDFKLAFFGGPRAVMRTPIACGTYRTDSVLTPWSAPGSGPPATPSDSFRIDAMPHGGPCVSREADAPNQPGFRAGTLSPVAGAYTPFVVYADRADGTQQIADMKVFPPPGLMGRLAGIPYCGDAEIALAEARPGRAEQASPSCPAGSRVGGVTVGIGSGPTPYYVEGHAYMAAPYRGAPVSLAVVVPAVAGPFDLGVVVVRSALAIDFKTGQIDVRSDPVPTIIGGVALNVRSIAVRVDRPNFVRNPTSCKPTSVNGALMSLPGQTVAVSSPFQIRGCKRLSFRPSLKLRLLGKPKRGAHPRLRAVLRMPADGANISRVAVRLPASQFFDGSHMRGICTEEQFASRACPADSVYGHVKAWTPLLDEPLKGPVYVRSRSEGLPGLVAELDGQFRFALDGRVTAPGGKIRANITGLPDAPVTKVVLTMRGGKQGLLQNSVNVCRYRQRAQVEFEGHNSKLAKLRPMLRGQCGKRQKLAALEPRQALVQPGR
ncbi:MAG: NHL repeat-containing protein [Solirubrobacterales bacterium]